MKEIKTGGLANNGRFLIRSGAFQKINNKL
jgi:hypothetical protein